MQQSGSWKATLCFSCLIIFFVCCAGITVAEIEICFIKDINVVNKTGNRPLVALDISNKILMIFLLLRFATMKSLGQFTSVSSWTGEFLMWVALNMSTFPQHLAVLFPPAEPTGCEVSMPQHSLSSTQRNPFAFMVRSKHCVGRKATRCTKPKQFAQLHVRAAATCRWHSNMQSYHGVPCTEDGSGQWGCETSCSPKQQEQLLL